MTGQRVVELTIPAELARLEAAIQGGYTYSGQNRDSTGNPDRGHAMEMDSTRGGQRSSGVTQNYQAGYHAAIESMKRMMEKHGIPYSLLSESINEEDHTRDEDTGAYPPTRENIGNAEDGLPRATTSILEQPLMAPPETPLFTGGPELWDGEGCRDIAVVEGAFAVGGGNADSFRQPRDNSRRAMQRRAQAEYGQHIKLQSRTKFTIRTDEAGNIITNKLRITSLIRKLMGMYVDCAQIHFEDNDFQFKRVEDAVRSAYEFVPPLREGWFPEYMRKSLEKSRSMYRKHFEEKGEKHPECPEDKHPRLMAWWASPIGRSKAQRMREMNHRRAELRRNNGRGGDPRHRTNPHMQIENMDHTSPLAIGAPMQPNPGTSEAVVHTLDHEVNDNSNAFAVNQEEEGGPTQEKGVCHSNKPSIQGNDTKTSHARLEEVLDECVNEEGDVSHVMAKLHERNDYSDVMAKLRALFNVDPHPSVENVSGEIDKDAGASRDITMDGGDHVLPSVPPANDNVEVRTPILQCNHHHAPDLLHLRKGMEINEGDDAGSNDHIRSVQRESPLSAASMTKLQNQATYKNADATKRLSSSPSITPYGNAVGRHGKKQKLVTATDITDPINLMWLDNSRGRPDVSPLQSELDNQGTVTLFSNDGGIVLTDGSKGRTTISGADENAAKKSKSKFEELDPPTNLTPRGQQKKIALGKNKDVWVLHPTRVGGPVALGKTGYSFRTTKKTLQSSQWRTIKWETGMQIVEILKVYQRGVKVMHPSKQPNRSVKLLDDVRDVESTSDAVVMWGSDYLVEINQSDSKSKKK